MTALDSAPAGVFAKSQFLRPITKGLMLRSARLLLSSSRVPTRPVQPHVALAGSGFPVFLEHLQCRLIRMKNTTLHELPVQPLDPIPPPSAEQEQRVREGVEVELLLNQGGQAVDAFSKVCVPAGHVDAVGSREVI